MTSRWNYLPLTAEEQKLETELARRFANVAPISELLVQRGIGSVAEAEKFFHPSLRDLHDPFLMPDMDKAVDRLNRAMGSKERIMVYGDYDVDGTTAVSLVVIVSMSASGSSFMLAQSNVAANALFRRVATTWWLNFTEMVS